MGILRFLLTADPNAPPLRFIPYERMAPALPAVLLLLPLTLLAGPGKFGAPLGNSPKVALADLVKDPAA